MRILVMNLALWLSMLAACVVDDGASLRRRAQDPRPHPRADGGPPSAEAFSALAGDLEASDGGVDEAPEHDAAGGSPDAEACGAKPSAASCHVCCLDANPVATAIERAALQACACDVTPSRASCRKRCGEGYCAGASAPSADCVGCIDELGGTCDAYVTSGCAANPAACAALDACVTRTRCDAKP